jgi:hypothetical protein
MTLTSFGRGVAKVQKALGRYYNSVPSLILIVLLEGTSTAEVEVVYMK